MKFIRTMDGELINSDSIIEIEGIFSSWLHVKISDGTSHYIDENDAQNSYQKMNCNNLSQILNGSDYNGRPAVKLMKKIKAYKDKKHY